MALHKPAATGFAQLPGQLVEDPTLPPDEFRVLAIVRLHDYGRGGGCFLSRAEIARRGCMSEATVKRALRELRKRGLIRTETSADGKSNNVHHWASDGGHTDPRVSLTPPRGSHRPGTGVTQTRDGGHTDPPLYKDEVDDYEVEDWEVDGRPAGPPAAAIPSPQVVDQQADAVTPWTVAAAILIAQGRPATPDSASPMLATTKALVVEPYAGRATLEQIRDCLAAMAKKPYFAGHLHRLTAKRLAEDLGPWLVAQTQAQTQAQRRQCACHAWLDEPGSIHTLHCMLSGPATSENYVDSVAKEVVYAEPRYVRDPYRAQLLSPEEMQEVSRHG